MVRQLLERGISQKLQVKKMRTLFKKFIDFEEKHGDASNVENIKRLAGEYVSKMKE